VYRRPLFPGYLFLRSGCGGLDDLWFWVRLAAGVRRQPFLMVDNQPAEIVTEKIAELQQLERSINTKRSERLHFRVGDRVLVSDGAFTGLRATVHMLSDHARVQLLLDFLGRKARVSVAADQIQAAA
jgi:transcription antitermination factor NusG